MIFFILGSHPTISIAEIAAVVGFKKDYSLASKEILILDEVEQTPEFLQNRLAGTVKIGDVVGEVKKFDQNEMADFIVSLLQDESKVTFGISVYSCGGNKKGLADEVKKLGMAVKKRLKENGQTARFVDSKESELSSAAIVGEKILENGGEFVLIALPDKIVVGQTRMVQDFKAWSNRDYGRPARDAKSGMLPPKLARMMINLTGSVMDKKFCPLLDPFCGSGTVLMEAALMGWPKITGGDISEKAIENTRNNLNWLQKNAEVNTTQIQLINRPIETLGEELKEKFNTIVAETFLGPPLTGHESPEKIRSIFSDLEKRTRSALLALAKLLDKNGTAILALPVFRINEKILYLPIKKIAAKAGLMIENILPDSLPKDLQSLTASGGLFYARPDQKVGREIVKLCPLKSTN
jgi:tRNA (guanine10-N2)-dimethyltransferase